LPQGRRTRPNYPWHRYWRSADQVPPIGFLQDAEEAFELDDHAYDGRCLILLAEPGLGKTRAVNDAVRRGRDAGLLVHKVELGAYDESASLMGAIEDAPEWRGWLASESVLFLYLDGLDEALLHVRSITKRLLTMLKVLDDSVLERLRLRISCRSAEWLEGFGQALGDALDTDPVVLRLMPLQATDVVVAADADGLDGVAFLAEVEERDVARLAASPLTLRMMLDIAADEGALPPSQHALFGRACVRLLGEHDDMRPDVGSLDVGQRLAVAQRISAALLLSGRAAVTTRAVGGDVRTRELAGFVEEDPDAAGDASFEVTTGALNEVLGTAFFVEMSSGRLGFWHRTLGEFLAAEYLVRHDMDVEQIMSLLTSADDADGQLIPQLREVAAWVVAEREDVLREVLRREPDVVLRTAYVERTDDLRRSIVDALLTPRAALRIDRWDSRTRDAMRALRHPGLAEQLRQGISKSSTLEVRRLAITFARACALKEFQHDLVALAFDVSEPACLRDDAVWGLKAYADDETRRTLIPLAIAPIADDTDDEIKGQALEATFPAVLSLAEVLAALTPARNEHLIGAYRMFVHSLSRALTREILPDALAWAAGRPVEAEREGALDELVDSVLAAAWNHLDDSLIADGVVDVLLPRLDGYGRLTAPEDEVTFYQPAGRRLLVEHMVEKRDLDTAKASELCVTTPPLVTAEDCDWLFERGRAALGSSYDRVWASMAESVFAPEVADVMTMLELVDVSAVYEETFQHWLKAIALDSETAKLYANRLARQRQRDAAEVEDTNPMRIAELLDAFEAGDSEAWWQINAELAGRQHRELEADLTKLDAWARLDEQIRARIVSGARPYLEALDPHPERWFGTNLAHRPAFAGYRALFLLAKADPTGFEALDVGVWERWIPIVVHYPRSSGDEVDDAIITAAARIRPTTLVRWVERAIDQESASQSGEGHLFVLSRLRVVDAPAMTEALAQKAAGLSLSARARADLMEHIGRSDQQLALTTAAPYITTARAAEHADEVTAVGGVLLSMAPAQAWPSLEPLFHDRPDLGVAIVSDVAYGDRVDLGSVMDDDALGRLLDWMFLHIAPRADPPLEAGAHWVSKRESAGRLRDRLASVLAQRGTDTAVALLESLVRQHPDAPGLEWRLREAREARLDRWVGPEPGDVVVLAQSNDSRIILSVQHLHQAVLASLRRIAGELQHGVPPTGSELWNTDPPAKPKHEEELSTWLAAKLKADLSVGGRLVGRELEIRPNITGKGRGESVDLVITSPIGSRVAGTRIAQVMIEVKGSWHKKVKTAMVNQLVARYLSSENPCGIYVVFWFDRVTWDRDDYRRGEWTKGLEETTAMFRDQAKALSESSGFLVSASVMNGSLPAAAAR
jgi:hypothetical protein